MKEGSVDVGKRIELKTRQKKAGPTVRTFETTLLLNVSSTTEPIRRHIGSVVELTFNTFNRPPKMIPHKDHRCSIVVVCNFDGTELDQEYSGKTPIQLKGTLNVSSI